MGTKRTRIERHGSVGWSREAHLTPPGDARTIGRGNASESEAYKEAARVVKCNTKWKNAIGEVTRTCEGSGFAGEICSLCGYTLPS